MITMALWLLLPLLLYGEWRLYQWAKPKAERFGRHLASWIEGERQ